MEDLSLDSRSLEHAPLGALQLVQARREQRLQCGRHGDVGVRLPDHREHLFDEQRIAARGMGDPRARISRDAFRYQLVDSFVVERPEPKGNRPGGPTLRELRTSQAEQQDRCVRREQSGLLDQVQERFLAPLEIVEENHERALCRRLRQHLADGPGDLVSRRGRVRLAEERADCRRRGLVLRTQVELLQDLDNRQVGDAFAVGRAAAPDHGRPDRRTELGGQPRLADAGLADHRDELAAPIGPHEVPALPEECELRLPSDERSARPRFGSSRTRKRRLDGRVSSSTERLDRLGVDS